MDHWIVILEVQQALASNLADQVSSMLERSRLSPELADRIRETIDRQREAAHDLRDRAVAAKNLAVEKAANEILERWSEVLAMIADAESSPPGKGGSED